MISMATDRVVVCIIRMDEERMIAKPVFRVLGLGSRKRKSDPAMNYIARQDHFWEGEVLPVAEPSPPAQSTFLTRC